VPVGQRAARGGHVGPCKAAGELGWWWQGLEVRTQGGPIIAACTFSTTHGEARAGPDTRTMLRIDRQTPRAGPGGDAPEVPRAWYTSPKRLARASCCLRALGLRARGLGGVGPAGGLDAEITWAPRVGVGRAVRRSGAPAHVTSP
jgi:hypothetical protein